MKAFLIYGPSGSGKTTTVRKISESQFQGNFLWVERDDIRFNHMNLGNWTVYRPNQYTENIVDAYWKGFIFKAVGLKENIIISDTLCKTTDRKKVKALMEHFGYEVKFIRMSTPLSECISRDKNRGVWSVGEKVIRSQWDHFTKGGWDDTTSDRLDKISG